MNEDINKKLESLEKAVAFENASARKSLAMSMVVYIALFVFVLLYTSFVYYNIRSMATPENVAALVTKFAEDKLSSFKADLKQQTTANAPTIAEHIVGLAHGLIPQGEKLIEQKIDAIVDENIAKFKTSLMPQLTDEVTAAFASAEAKADFLKEKNIPAAYAEIMAEALDKEIGDAIDENAKDKMEELSLDIAKLKNTATSKMTAKQLAEKKCIIYWLFLVNNAPVGQSPFAGQLRLLSDFARQFTTFVAEPAK